MEPVGGFKVFIAEAAGTDWSFMNYLVLLGIVIVVVGFALKLDSILIVIVAGLATALIGLSLIHI